MFCIYVQEDFLQLVYKETILVGHSLENDLLALKIQHDLVVDTAILYRHPHGRSYKTALRILTRKFLSRVIQDSGNGHDSVEDARATMELALLKFKNGMQFVIAPCMNTKLHESDSILTWYKLVLMNIKLHLFNYPDESVPRI